MKKLAKKIFNRFYSHYNHLNTGAKMNFFSAKDLTIIFLCCKLRNNKRRVIQEPILNIKIPLFYNKNFTPLYFPQ